MGASRASILVIVSLWGVAPVAAQDHRPMIKAGENMCTIDVGSALVIREGFIIPQGEQCLSRHAPHQVDSGETLCRFCRSREQRVSLPELAVVPGDYAVTAVSCDRVTSITVRASDGMVYDLSCGNDYLESRSIQNFINAWSRPGRPGPFFRGVVTRRAVSVVPADDSRSGASASDSD